MARIFDSLGAFIDYVENTPKHPAHEYAGSIMYPAGGGWTPQDWPDTLRAARYGWPEGLARMHKAKEQAQRIIEAQADRRPVYALDVAGFRPHPARAAAGDPLAMVKRGQQTRQRRRTVRIGYNTRMDSHQSAEQVENRGAALLAYVDQLEAAGIRCEIWAHTCKPIHMGQDMSLEVCLKQPEEPLDLDKLAFCMLNAGYHRRLCFKHYETFRYVPSGYGSSGDEPLSEYKRNGWIWSGEIKDGQHKTLQDSLQRMQQALETWQQQEQQEAA